MRMLAACALSLVILTTHATGFAAERHGRGTAADRHTVGTRVDRLPSGRFRVHVGNRSLFYYGGVFYEPRRPGYIVVRPPMGAHVPMLPTGYVSFGIGLRHFFFVNSTYYLWEPRTRDYVVVAEPEGAAAAMTADGSAESYQVFAYPNQGQTEEQARRDRYECHLWAADQSGFDPTYSDDTASAASKGDYRRAITACLVGRGYVVR